MKKVLKKFNRTLSIMLAAAMVLTMVPQTAMPVLAAEEEQEQIEVTNETAPEEEVTVPADENDGDEESADVGKTENPENSGDSDTTEGETNTEEGDGSDDEQSGEQTPEETPDVTDPSETEISDETEVEAPEEEETEISEDEEDVTEGEKNEVLSATPNALIPSELTISAVEPDTAPGTTKALVSAKITYTNGCVSGDKMRKDTDITFKLDPVAGKKLGDIQFTTKGAAADATESAAKAVTVDGDTYKIAKSDLMHEVTAADGTKEMVNDVSVTIIVNTTDVQYTLKADDDSSTDYRVYLTKTEENKTTADTTKEIVTAGLADKINFADNAKDISFAVVKDGSATGKIRRVTVVAGGEETILDSKAATDDDAKSPIYTFKPSELDGLAQNDLQDIVIKVEATAAATVSIATKSEPVGAVIFGAVGNAAELYTGADAFVQAGGDSPATSATEGQKVVFTATVDEEKYIALKAADITATYTPNGGEAKSIGVELVEAKTVNEKAIPAHYVIDLADVTVSGALAITAKTTLDDTKDAVKKVDFSSVSENSVVVGKPGGDDNLAGKTEKTLDASYTFDAEAKPGYEIYKVEAVYTKTYTDDNTTEDCVDALYADVSYIDPETGKPAPVDGNLTNLSVVFAGTDNGSKAWTTKVVKVNVYAKMTEVEDEKTVTIVSAYDYVVATGDKVAEGDSEDEYIVKPGADFFKFTVEAVTEPIITAENSDGVSLVGAPEKTEAGYVYQIAAGALEDMQRIEIERRTFGIEVSYDKENVDAEVYAAGSEDAESPTDATDTKKDVYSGVSADSTYKFIIAAKNDTTKISKVSYTVGDGEEQAVTARGGSYVFSTDVTGVVKVTVETADEYDLIVNENDEAVTPDKNGVYNVGHASVVTAQLLKGTGKMSLFNADVKDGSAVAATIARITDNVVTLEFDSTEYNKVLTVELTLNDKARTVKTFKVKTTAAAAEVSLAGVKNSKVEIPVDTKASYKLTVKTKNASAAGLAAKVVPADDTKKADAAAIKAATDAVSAEIKEGSLVITAKPAMTGTADVAKVIIVDESGLTEAQKEALNVDNALKGGVVTVTTKDATIVGKAPTVKLVSTTDKEIKVQLGVPKEVVNPIEGKIFYKVELTVPQSPVFPEGVSDEQKAAITAALTLAATEWNTKHLYQGKEGIDAQGGLLEIPVMQFTDANVTAGLDKGALLSGFSVTATLLQTTAEAGDPSAAATTIEGGSAALENIATKNPYYEVKLGLKKGTTTLITGQDKDMTVATPNFNKLTSYSSVKVEFVDTSSGKILVVGEAGEGYAAAYRGMYVKYDALSNAVIVNAKGATYKNNANDYYKNLGVKVTAYAEDSAYGAVATQKLTVVNGIENINPSAPLEIYKADKKAASFTVTTDLNEVIEAVNKKYAPKAKKLSYEIVAADSEKAEDLAPNLKANVTVAKNGKVTINKNYVVAPKAAQNQFKVKVSAADYADSDVVECTDTITITDEGLQMGEIAVFDGTGKLVAAASGSIEATKKSGEYRVAVLAPGVKTTKKTYDLSKGSSDIINPELLTFKSSNAKSVGVNPDNGALTVYKAAKNVKITAVPKDGSNPKPVKTLTLTVGQVSTSPLLRISRYYTSTLTSGSGVNICGETTINYNGNSTNNYFSLEIVKAVTDNGNTRYEPFYLANYSISYKGAKQIKKTTSYNCDSFLIVANAADAVITLKDKANNSAAPVVYTLHNNDFVSDKNAKAPKIATTTKMTQNTYADYVYYTVKGGKTDDFTGKYVMLSVDRTKKNPTDIQQVFRVGNDSYLDKPLPILMGAGFNLYVNTACDSGNYNLVATVGSLTDGVFKPEYKDAKVTVKIAKAKAASLSATGNYTLSLKANSGAYIKYKSGNGWATFTNKADDNDNYAKNAIINGQENNFTDYFEVKKDDYGMYVALKDLPLTAPDNNKDAPALDKIADDANKNDRIGYISINNGSKYIDVKLTIAIKDYTKDKTKYKVTATPVLDGPKAVTALTILEGKANVDVAAMMAVSTVGFTPIYDRDGNCYLEAANLEAGNHKVDLYIVPRNAPQAYRDAIANASGDAAKREAYEKYGIKTSITVKATDKATTKNKVAVVNKGSNKWTVADTDYNAPAGWSKYTPFTFKNKLSVAETTDIAIAASVNGKAVDYVSFDLADKKYMAYETLVDEKCIKLPTSYPMQITLDKAKLAAAIAADASNAEIAAAKKLDWGKTISVKATFSYGANGPKEDEVTFQIKLPGSAGAAEQAVEEALKAAESRLQSNIETYTKGLVDVNSDWLSDEYEDASAWINGQVEAYIRNEVNKAIQGAAVTVAITNDGKRTTTEDGTETITVQLATAWTVSVKSTAAGTKELYNNVFKIPAVETAAGIVSAIESLNLSDNVSIKDSEGKELLKVTADTTPAQFAAAVRAKLTSGGTAVTRYHSITAVIVGETKAPTTTTAGAITFRLTVKDLSKVPGNPEYSEASSRIVYTLNKLDDFDTCKKNVSDGLNAVALTAIVKEAWMSAQADEAFAAKVKELVLAKANELIDNNPAVTVDGFAKDADDKTKDLFTLTKPTGGAKADGKIAFTLHLKDEATPETEDNAADFKVVIAETTLNVIEEFQTPAELLTEAQKITEIDYVADQDAALEAIKAKVVKMSVNPGYDTSSISVEPTPGEEGGDGGTKFTAPADGNDGSITKVIVKVGTGEDDKATLNSVTIKKQETTPAPEVTE